MHLVIFDVDGTLIDSQDHIVAAMAHGFADVGMAPPPRGAVLGIVGLSLPQAMQVLVPGIDDDLNARICAAYKSAWADLALQGPPPLYPGAAQVLADLATRDDIVLGIATGKSRKGLDALIKAHGWHGMFAVMVGDTEFDMQMAASAGVAGIVVDWGYHPPERVAARHRVAQFGQLPAMLQQVWGQA